jgi:alkylation response protein AidB-like acyl-CoA dehydrogenase
VDFRLTPEQEAFRREVEEFLARELPAERREIREDGWVTGFSREFSRKLGARGWIGLTWPRRYGGQERSPLDRLVLTETLLLAGAPVAAHWLGDRQVGPALLAHGSEAQKAFFLPCIARGEIVFCVGMSEPAAGSDLAATSTLAVEDGEGFVIRGQKVWTSFAHQAEYCYLVARTNPEAPKHRGLSELVVDMRTPGITVRPLLDMVGEHHFNEVFFDEVRVPRTALVGVKDRGWQQIVAQLDFERGGIERVLSNYPLFQDALAWARAAGLTRDPRVRDRLARLHIELHAARLLVYRTAWRLSRGERPTWETALTKRIGTELEQEIAEAVLGLFGPAGLLMPGAPGAPLGGRAARAALYAPAYTIQGGTANILRNIIAIRGLGLPAD